MVVWMAVCEVSVGRGLVDTVRIFSLLVLSSCLRFFFPFACTMPSLLCPDGRRVCIFQDHCLLYCDVITNCNVIYFGAGRPRGHSRLRVVR